jgi:hypothetical protein
MGKGNWPSEMSWLQYLTGCPISWRCDMISKRATKSKPNTHKVMARARNWEIFSNRSKGHAKAWERRRSGSGPARAGTGLSLHPNLARPELVRSSQSRLAKALLPPRRSRRISPEASMQASDHHSLYLRIHAAMVLSKEESWPRNCHSAMIQAEEHSHSK